MISLRTLVVALAGSSLISAGCCDVSLILSDISVLQGAINDNIGNITAYTGGFNGVQALSDAGTEVTTALGKADADVNASRNFGNSDSRKILNSMATTMGLVLQSLNALDDKETLFRAAGINGNVKSSLVTHAAEEQTLFNDLASKAPSQDAANFLALQQLVAAKYNETLANYS